MFWARGDALAPLFEQGIRIDDFPEESGQTDGTLNHCLERMFVLCSQKQGMEPGIIRDVENPSWSAWRFDQYTSRSYESIAMAFNSSNIKLIAFDIFDTLLVRPLLDPESTKLIVARLVGGEAGDLYEEFRAQAEEQARAAKGFDVDLDEIYSSFGAITKLPDDLLSELMRVEKQVEKASLAGREDAIHIFKAAVNTGKPVVLISDMFLPRAYIETCLRENGLDGWDAVFISNDVGLRKENGMLYGHVLKHYDVTPNEMLMVGDNEHSDIQVPSDMGASFLHILKPIDLACGLPRFSALVSRCNDSGSLDAEISLGLVVRKNFSPVFYRDFDPEALVQPSPYNLGYSFIGPLLASFVQWLIQRSQEDGIDRLYFLSREGKLIKRVYDAWRLGQKNSPESEYLVISRRAAGVAAIFTLNDIFNIARTVYYSNTIENYLFTRYGLRLSDERWAMINQAQGWNRSTLVKVQGGKIDHLVPLLQALQTEIFAKAENERNGMIQYIAAKGLQGDGRQAVVDVGYGGSVQGYINKLTKQKVNGYYLMTDERAESLALTYNVFIRGCFHENISSSTVSPVMFRSAFELEKLLSSDEAQIEYYAIEAAGNVKGYYRELLPEEMECAEIREQLQSGVMDYVNDARRVRESLFPEFQPSVSIAQTLLEAFFTNQSAREIYLLSRIVLDDNYCGLGLVSTKVSQE
jgi:HAD superfamily hydrolase (TIGR01549 family)